MSKLSVIVTSHSYGHFLRECLESIKAQSFQDFELIIVDDGSSDQTNDVAREFSPTHLLRLEERVGTVAAKNAGIAKSIGEYVVCIDADDTIDPLYFERCVNALDANSDVALAYTDFWHFGGTKNGGVVFPEYSLEQLKKWNFILGSAMFRRKAYDEVRGFDSLMKDGLEDYECWLSMCERGWKAIHVPGYLYRYRSHESNRTNTMDLKSVSCKLWRKHGMLDRMKEFQEKVEVTATISTKDRYFTTLPLAIDGILHQTYLPKEFILFDDAAEPKDLRNEPLYQNLFAMFAAKGIAWKVIYGRKMGQVRNHQLTLDLANYDWIWRLDDDNIPEPTALEKLVNCVAPDVGAIGGLVLDPKMLGALPALASSRIEDIYLGMNIQWFRQSGLKEVDHLYSTFLYRKAAGKHGYCLDLSPAGHREETIFSYGIKRAGWALLVNPESVTWHIRSPQGGIRTYTQEEYWRHDEEIFRAKLLEWNVRPRELKLVILDCGLGDHFTFAQMVDELIAKHKDKRIVLAVCYPDVFKGKDVEIISIADAKMLVGDKAVDYNVYKHCWDKNWKKPLVEAYKEMYL